MPVIKYSWSDAGAPQMSATVGVLGSLNNILKKCLVEGYGSKPGAGWTVAFEDIPTNKLVLRNTGGSGMYYRFDDNVDYRYASCIAYHAMTDMNTGTNEIPPQAGSGGWLANNPVGIWKRYNANAAEGTWWHIIACEKAAYIFTKNVNNQSYGLTAQSNGVWVCTFIGDIKSYIPNDPYCGALCGEYWGDRNTATTTGYSTGGRLWANTRSIYGGYLGASTAYNWLNGDHQGIRRGIAFGTYGNMRDLMVGNTLKGYGVNGSTNVVDPITGNTSLSKIYITHQMITRGEWPGLLYPIYKPTTWPAFVDMANDGVLAGQKWLGIISGAHYDNNAAAGLIGCIRYDCPTSDWYS